MGSETVKDAARLQRLLAYLEQRVRRRTALGKLWYYHLCDRVGDELARRQGPPPG
jgi:hypothetical protein